MTKEIPLTQGKVALVDDEDYEVLSKHMWYAQKNKNTYYALRNSPTDPVTHKRTTIHMHAVIAGTPPGRGTDHINGNGLDNRRGNIRVVNSRENGQNKHRPKSSKYTGVSWHKQSRKWEVGIQFNSKN